MLLILVLSLVVQHRVNLTALVVEAKVQVVLSSNKLQGFLATAQVHLDQ